MKSIARLFEIAMLATALAFTANSQELPRTLTSWPITVEEVVQDIILRLSVADKSRIRSLKEDELITVYFDWGVEIRNRYGLWQGNDKLIVAACGRICHPDDAAMEIIRATWRRLREQSR
jgi:hypothetical protein